MNPRPAPLLVLFATLAAAQTAAAQTPSSLAPPYDPVKTFAPLALPDPVNSYRSSNGSPGPDYWQNSADYELRANLDTAAKQLSATEVITYVNHSPDTLPSLWLQLEQNAYRKDSRSIAIGGRPRADFTDGFVFDSIEIEAAGKATKPAYIISDTRMQIRLTQPLKGKGGALKIHIVY